jgi:hypothetical protein
MTAALPNPLEVPLPFRTEETIGARKKMDHLTL